MRHYPALETFLAQAREERAELEAGYADLKRILASKSP